MIATRTVEPRMSSRRGRRRGRSSSVRETSKLPRVVVVTRPTEYELLIARHGTRMQAAFFLESRGRSMGAVEQRHHRHEAALAEVTTAIPVEWRRSRVSRAELDRFLFEPDDTIVVVGQDGLVANVAKYLNGQPVLGINPDPSSYDGVLVPLPPEASHDLLVPASQHTARTESRTMVHAALDDGQELVALNELFVGHASHQSARYRIETKRGSERQSSSGILVTTGTGATGWARSVHRNRRTEVLLPCAHERRLAFFVREAFPSVSTETSMTDGDLGENDVLEIVSEMNDGGVVFGDGIETDRLGFEWGMTVRIEVARTTLELVVA